MNEAQTQINQNIEWVKMSRKPSAVNNIIMILFFQGKIIYTKTLAFCRNKRRF